MSWPQRQKSSGCSSAKNPTPNLRDKVMWYPEARTWKVLAVTKPKDLAYTKELIVDELNGDEFFQMKMEKYLLAIDEWNKHDKSESARIPVPPLMQVMTNND